jgi:dGTPase
MVRLSDEARLKVEVLKNFAYKSLILTPDLQVVRHRGQEIVTKLFQRLASDGEGGLPAGNSFLPGDVRAVHDAIDSARRPRVVCDFIAGMTDQYAVEYYSRMFSESPQTIFKRV